MVPALQRDRGRQPTRRCRQHAGRARPHAKTDHSEATGRVTPRRRRDTLTDLRGDSQLSV
jgi:hypothetical protein